eukprot:1351949-Amorphochlora_amoeboformis.AAC.3
MPECCPVAPWHYHSYPPQRQKPTHKLTLPTFNHFGRSHSPPVQLGTPKMTTERMTKSFPQLFRNRQMLVE